MRTVTDPDNVDAEFGILVRSDLQGASLGRLLTKMIDHQGGRGTKRLVVTGLREATRMLALAKELVLAPEGEQREPGAVQVAMELS